MSDVLAALKLGATELGLSLSDVQLEQLQGYLALIRKWNKVYNLTAVRDPQEMLTHHLLDSLTAVAPLLRHTGGAAVKVLDVGSGGGLPGVVLAICRPELDISCVDTVGKKYMPDDDLFKLVNMVSEVVPGVLGQLGKVKNPWPNVDAISGTLQYRRALFSSRLDLCA